MTDPGDQGAATAGGGGRLRASRADREQVVELLKTAFVQDRLTKDELDTRVGRALASRTYADLADLIADVPPAPAGPGPADPPTPARHRLLARAAAGSGGCLVIAAAAVWAAFILDPGPGGPHPHGSSGVGWCFVLAIYAVIAAVCIMGVGLAKSVEQRRSRRQLPPQPGPDGQTLEAGRHGGTGHGPVPPGPRTNQTCADLRPDSSQPRRPHSYGRGARTLRGVIVRRTVNGVTLPCVTLVGRCR